MDNQETLENCPHCGAKLSPWQKVLLNVDRAIMCKKCWYRIILDPIVKESKKENGNKVENETRRRDGNV